MLRTIAVVALAGLTSATSFSGVGHIRAVVSSSSGNGTDHGCLTNTGSWTVAESGCGTFTGTRSSTIYTNLTSLAGPCTLDVDGNFVCGADQTPLQFWAWSGLLDDYDVLAHSETITYSSTTNISDAGDSAIPIRTYRTSDPKPWIWLTWSL